MCSEIAIRAATEGIEVTIPEATFALGKLAKCTGLVGLDRSNGFFEHCLCFCGAAKLCGTDGCSTKSAGDCDQADCNKFIQLDSSFVDNTPSPNGYG